MGSLVSGRFGVRVPASALTSSYGAQGRDVIGHSHTCLPLCVGWVWSSWIPPCGRTRDRAADDETRGSTLGAWALTLVQAVA
jgi:hypothetical protein